MTISECVRSSPWWGVVKSLGYYRRGPVGLVHTQNFRLPIRKAHLGTTSDTRLFSGEKRTSHFKRVKSVQDPTRSAPGSWQRIGGESPPRGRSSQPPRPRVMHEVLLARAAVKRSQGRPRAKY